MGFFAIVDPLGGDALNKASNLRFEVVKLDVNVWLLPLLAGRNAVWCDVGVRLQAETSLTCFDVAIPFGTSDGCLVDLSPGMRDARVSTLVFGEAVRTQEGHLVDPQSDYGSLRPISVAGCKRLESLCTSDFSLWRIELQNELIAGSEAYVRFRLKTKRFRRTVVWRRSLVRRVGALVDLHFYDAREAALLPSGERYQENMKAAGRVNAFFISMATLRLRKASPELRYLRLLEGTQWERYLERATDLRRSGKFLVHYWRQLGPVDPENEFRAFLDLGRRTESLGWSTGFAVVLATVVLMQITNGGSDFGASLVGRLGSEVLGWGGFVRAAFLAVGVVGGLSLLQLLPMVKNARVSVGRALRRFEAWIYRKRAEL